MKWAEAIFRRGRETVGGGERERERERGGAGECRSLCEVRREKVRGEAVAVSVGERVRDGKCV